MQNILQILGVVWTVPMWLLKSAFKFVRNIGVGRATTVENLAEPFLGVTKILSEGSSTSHIHGAQIRTRQLFARSGEEGNPRMFARMTVWAYEGSRTVACQVTITDSRLAHAVGARSFPLPLRSWSGNITPDRVADQLVDVATQFMRDKCSEHSARVTPKPVQRDLVADMSVASDGRLSANAAMQMLTVRAVEVVDQPVRGTVSVGGKLMDRQVADVQFKAGAGEPNGWVPSSAPPMDVDIAEVYADPANRLTEEGAQKAAQQALLDPTLVRDGLERFIGKLEFFGRAPRIPYGATKPVPMQLATIIDDSGQIREARGVELVRQLSEAGARVGDRVHFVRVAVESFEVGNEMRRLNKFATKVIARA